MMLPLFLNPLYSHSYAWLSVLDLEGMLSTLHKWIVIVKSFLDHVILSSCCHIFGFGFQNRKLCFSILNYEELHIDGNYFFFPLMWICLSVIVTDINMLIVTQQLVQFLLKQAGVDKRTGDLFGNRDLMNIARNMARGLKVRIEILWLLYHIFDDVSFQPGVVLSFSVGCWECIHPAPTTSFPNHGKHCQRTVERCRLPICWKSLSTRKVCCYEIYYRWLTVPALPEFFYVLHF